jgi:DNA polymerase III epsilon subunit-like protein
VSNSAKDGKKRPTSPKILLYDIETAPILANVWKIWDENVGLNQIIKDWHLLSWSAKWLGEKEIFYADQRKAKKIEDDKELLQELWELIDAADIVITHNGKKFDQKKIQTRFVMHGMQPPSSVRHIDTLLIAKRHFSFTSNKLEFLAAQLCGSKKSTHKKFPGFELWRECIAGNLAAWKEMEEYNKKDVVVLEELYRKLAPWDTTNLWVYQDEAICKCGSSEQKKNGWFYTATAKYQRFKCLSCGYETRSNKSVKTSAQRGTTR